MIDLQNLLRLVGIKLKTKVDDRGNGLYRIDVPLVYKDGTERNQFVWVRISKEITQSGKDTLFFQSRAGILQPDMNPKDFLREAYYGFYTMICIVDEQDEDGNDVEMVYVQASPIIDYSTNFEELIYECVTECAIVADFLEKKYWGGDIR
jgi:hypothetical protein